jgi:hypothetical protein
MTTFYNHLCDNCGAWLEPHDPALCSACTYLLAGGAGKYKRRSNGETEGFVNRRWQCRFNRGELRRESANAGVLWEAKKKVQSW